MAGKRRAVYTISITYFMGMEAAIFTTDNQTGLILLSGILLMFVMGITLLAFFYFSKKKIIQKELEKKNIELQHSKETA
jgi:hypothetical protein